MADSVQKVRAIEIAKNAILGVALLTVSQQAIQAQESGENRRRGFTWGISVGQASLDYSCGPGVFAGIPHGIPCNVDGRAGSWIGHVNVGWTVSSNLVVGLASDGWSRQGLNESGSVHSILMRYYASANSGVFIAGGIGVSASHIRQTNGPPFSGRGPGIVLGIGVDMPVDDGYSLTLQIRGLFGDQGPIGPSVVDPGGTVIQATRTDVRQTAVGVLLGITFH